MTRTDSIAENGADLVRRVADGDTEAMGSLYDRFSADAYGTAMRITRDRQLAEDAVQETFVAVWRTASRYLPELASPRTWICTIARNRSIDIMRGRRFMKAVEWAPETQTEPAATDVWPDVVQRLDRAMLLEAMSCLPVVQQVAIELAFLYGRTHVEIAAITFAPLGTVKSRVRLGLHALRRILRDPSSLASEQPAHFISPAFATTLV